MEVDRNQQHEVVSGIVGSNERLLRTQTRGTGTNLYFGGEQVSFSPSLHWNKDI